jgi:hypothetical protein
MSVMIKCVKLRRYRKNTLLGFADLELTSVGVVLHDCPWHRHPNGKEWIGFAARPYETASGERSWQPIIEFAEGAGEARRHFQEQALAAIHAVVAEQDPGAAS